jgi:undecaprenyl-diphosphatase
VQSRPDAAARALRALPRWHGSPRSLRLAVTLSVTGILLALVAGLVVRGSTAGLGFDLWLNGLHSPALDAVSQAVSVGFQPTSAVVIGLLLAVVVWLRTRHVVAGLAAGAAVACGWLVTGVLKVVVSRPRPEWTDAVHRIVPPETDGSYPSGHVAFATALATVIVLLVWRTAARGWTIAAGALLVVVTALARMYVVVHYPTDVVAGALCAVCGVVLAYATMELVARRWAVPAEAEEASARR